ncbi:hypothetical protein CCAE64S_01398 [Castellaniella caeni]
MKTTLNMHERLSVKAKALATRQQAALAPLPQERPKLPRQKQGASAASVWLPVYHGQGGLVPGLDASSNKALLKAAERDA